jgi:hypothetical protein
MILKDNRDPSLRFGISEKSYARVCQAMIPIFFPTLFMISSAFVSWS